MLHFLHNEYDVRQYARQLKNFYGELSTYVFTITFCLIIWLLSGAGYFWPFWIILIWGIGLFLKASKLYIISPRYYEATHAIRENLPFIKSSWEDEKVKELLKNCRISHDAPVVSGGKKRKKG